MAEIGRSLDEIDSKVKKLNETLKQSTAQTRELDKAVKLDPKATEVAAQRMKNLSNQIGIATQKVALLKQKQLEATKAFNNGDMTAKEFNKIEVAVMKAENELRSYNKQLNDATQAPTLGKISSLSKGFDSVTKSLKGSQKELKAFSKLALALVTTLAGAVTAFAKTTLEIDEMAKAYEHNIETMQLQRSVYKEITGDADNYNKTLDSMKSVLNSIALGQGAEYANILKYIGVSTTDVNGKTRNLNEVYTETISALEQMEDMQLRNQIAYELFGDQAVSILEVMSLTSEQLEELNQKTMENGIITEQNAESARAIQEQWDSVKQQFMQVSAVLAESLLPLIQSLAQFVNDFVLPIITAIANWFAGMSPTQQKFVFFLLMMIILLPKIVSIVTVIVGVIKAITVASYGAAGGVGAVSAAATPLIPVILGVVAVVLTLAIIFAFLTGRSNELSKSLDAQKGQMEGIASSYDSFGGDLDITSNQVSQNSNSSTQDINVNITSEGENPIAEENAEIVADLLAERINKELGGKI